MKLHLKRAGIEDAQAIWKMQKTAFAVLLQKYQDLDTNPACEPLSMVTARMELEQTFYYYILLGQDVIGVIRVVDRKDGSTKRIAPVFILPAYQGKGYAQRAIKEAEKIHGSEHWKLDTILEEQKLCHLYEKMGYKRTGTSHCVNERMTLIDYEK